MKLIDKDALVAEIDERIKDWNEYYDDMRNAECHELASKAYLKIAELKGFKRFIDTLEVKDVDLKKEIDEYFKGWCDYQGIDSSVTDQEGNCVTLDDIKDACRYFFELRVKAKQG